MVEGYKIRWLCSHRLLLDDLPVRNAGSRGALALHFYPSRHRCRVHHPREKGTDLLDITCVARSRELCFFAVRGLSEALSTRTTSDSVSETDEHALID